MVLKVGFEPTWDIIRWFTKPFLSASKGFQPQVYQSIVGLLLGYG